MSWNRLLSSPLFVFIAVGILMAMTGTLLPLATLIASAMLQVVNVMIVPIAFIGLLVLVFRKLSGMGGGDGRRGH